MYNTKQKYKKVCELNNIFRAFSKFYENKKLLDTNFCNFEHPKTFSGVVCGPAQNLSLTGSAVRIFDTNRQTIKVDI